MHPSSPIFFSFFLFFFAIELNSFNRCTSCEVETSRHGFPSSFPWHTLAKSFVSQPHLDEKNGAPLPTPTRQAVGAGRPAPTGDSAKYPWADDANPSGEASGKGRRHAVDGAGGVRGAEGVPRAEEALALPDGDYLSSCRLIFVGFAAEDLRPLMLLVRKGCGVR